MQPDLNTTERFSRNEFASDNTPTAVASNVRPAANTRKDIDGTSISCSPGFHNAQTLSLSTSTERFIVSIDESMSIVNAPCVSNSPPADRCSDC